MTGKDGRTSSSTRATDKQVSKYEKAIGTVKESTPLDITHVSCEAWRDAVVAILLAGDAVLFGLTRDGGAVCIQVMEGMSRHKTYADNAKDLETKLLEFGKSASGL